MKSAPRVVLDTSVVLSAVVFGSGPVGRVREGWQAGTFIPLACSATAKELVRVLGYPQFALSAHEQEELLGDYLPWVEIVELTPPIPDVPPCRDPLDLPFLLLAVKGRAHALVSGDHHLLDLAGRLGKCAVLDATTFRDRYLGR